MPWKECSVMDERLRFVAKLLDGESMSEVCREFGISRKTGYKIFNRSRSSRCGGCALASASSASSLDIRSKTAAMSACT